MPVIITTVLTDSMHCFHASRLVFKEIRQKSRKQLIYLPGQEYQLNRDMSSLYIIKQYVTKSLIW